MSTLAEQLVQTEAHRSIFETAVRRLPLPVCAAFGATNQPQPVSFQNSGRVLSTKDSAAVQQQFPQSVAASGNLVLSSSGTNNRPSQGKRVAVLFSGGPAAGGHNVVCGLKRILGAGNTLFGVKAGPKGLLKGSLFEITDQNVDFIINTGGFDFLGSDRTKIKSDEQFAQVRETCIKHNLDAIVVVGGDDSNTNAAVLAESLFTGVKADGSGVQVIGVPKTIDGDLQIGDLLSISFGFDTATRIYSEMVGNILQDTSSSLKYWHFVKLMGRSASHVALEVALQTKPAIALISEEIATKKQSLASIIDHIAQVVVNRSHQGMNYGVLLAPEGLIEFIPEMNAMIAELNDALAHHAAAFAELTDNDAKATFIGSKLSADNAALLESLPHYIVNMLLADRDSHGNLQVSLIPTEQLLIDMTKQRVKEIDPKVPFAAHSHFLGYEGRCGAPTLFDAAYTYNLGLTAGSLILDGRTGYMATVTGLTSGGTPQAIPLAGLLNIERRHGKDEFVIEKALVKMDSPAMQYFVSRREAWAASDLFASPGPRQFWGPTTHQLPISVALNSGATSLMFTIG
ncbi:MAG TPA: diphosphate--fructose-6-phosphate 1-phosphotransferase [Accumulibacter sp.]|nr:diphosphate--fructose-6-phosphate 1-phosphotransferase [Accumulibacter sp.]HMW17646.1 diphosphate--fructose-6-phosphate 1-phosphotransferase [Accumulibacter sp.]HMX23606.1 diphosphate--fructose-6-phosphate 1-phosphotransferase [Accumulibacter sp.]HMY07351.1 diphosphate--fructose-6-phosphate 1-phosphotransferase [Accumulibacter sp.]HND81499.1 diphosphate--fructose-6-phosphate 1-phosphotransferase [Accumulibacter sp.]